MRARARPCRYWRARVDAHALTSRSHSRAWRKSGSSKSPSSSSSNNSSSPSLACACKHVVIHACQSPCARALARSDSMDMYTNLCSGPHHASAHGYIHTHTHTHTQPAVATTMHRCIATRTATPTPHLLEAGWVERQTHSASLLPILFQRGRGGLR